jgi:hypothetical protein
MIKKNLYIYRKNNSKIVKQKEREKYRRENETRLIKIKQKQKSIHKM